MAVCQNLVPLVNIKIAGKWMFIPLKMVLIGIDPYPYEWACICITIQSPTSPIPISRYASPPGSFAVQKSNSTNSTGVPEKLCPRFG